MEPKAPHEVRTKAPIIPLQARHWPRWFCPRCQAKHYLEIDYLMAVTRLTCSTCKAKWNVLMTFTSATAKSKDKRSYPAPAYLAPELYPLMPNVCTACGAVLDKDGTCYHCTHPRRPADDGIVTDYTGENVLCKVCGNPLEDDGECLLCGKHTGALPEAQEVTDENSSGL